MSQTFEAIGAFIFELSQLEFAMRVVLSRALGLSEEQFDAVTSPYDFAMLCTVTKTILTQRSPSQKASIDDLFARCQGLNTERVRVAHATWLDDGKTLTARHVARSSLIAKHYFKDIDELTRLAEKARRLMSNLLDIFAPPEADAPKKWRLLQAKEIMLRFAEAHDGRQAATPEESDAWLATQT